jgi:hypothetical protein
MQLREQASMIKLQMQEENSKKNKRWPYVDFPNARTSSIDRNDSAMSRSIDGFNFDANIQMLGNITSLNNTGQSSQGSIELR